MRRDLFAIVAGALALPACLGCTQIGGIDGLIVDVSVAGGALPPGQYAIVVEADGATMTIDENLDTGGGGFVDPPDVEVAGGKHLFVSGALDAGGMGGSVTVGYREGGGPADIVVTVRRGTTELGRMEYLPSYEVFRPNGLGCGPTVYQAHGTLTLTR